jgi:molecular chaperone GrpE
LSKSKKPEDEKFDTEGVEIESVGASTPDSELAPEGEPELTLSADKVAEFERQKTEAEKWKNDYLYLRADFDNYRKAMVKERSDIVKYGTERLLHDILDAFDNFERALEQQVTADNFATFREGVQLTANELKKIFEKHGVKEVKTHGEAFNPAVHEALSSEETDSVPEGHISRVHKKAYKLHDRVIRPAQVVVATAPKPKEG